ncbi:MAG: MarR family transcriptional regulator [Gammaproteobacteria bacterium]|nr:MarR family transcriptional regulator [Gammaproteobacteria bacterium]
MENSQQRSSRVIVEELVDEILRLRGRVLSQARDMNEKRGLGGYSQGLILTAVVRAVEPPTVAKIARSLGLTRQSVQRTANELAERELVVFEDNPHHKRAKQLVPTAAGIEAHASVADTRKSWLDSVGAVIGADELEQAVTTLRRVRRYLEHPESLAEITAPATQRGTKRAVKVP